MAPRATGCSSHQLGPTLFQGGGACWLPSVPVCTAHPRLQISSLHAFRVFLGLDPRHLPWLPPRLGPKRHSDYRTQARLRLVVGRANRSEAARSHAPFSSRRSPLGPGALKKRASGGPHETHTSISAYGRPVGFSMRNATLYTGAPPGVRPSYLPRWAWPCTTALTVKRSMVSASRDEPRNGKISGGSPSTVSAIGA